MNTCVCVSPAAGLCCPLHSVCAYQNMTWRWPDWNSLFSMLQTFFWEVFFLMSPTSFTNQRKINYYCYQYHFVYCTVIKQHNLLWSESIWAKDQEDETCIPIITFFVCTWISTEQRWDGGGVVCTLYTGQSTWAAVDTGHGTETLRIIYFMLFSLLSTVVDAVMSLPNICTWSIKIVVVLMWCIWHSFSLFFLFSFSVSFFFNWREVGE